MELRPLDKRHREWLRSTCPLRPCWQWLSRFYCAAHGRNAVLVLEHPHRRRCFGLVACSTSRAGDECAIRYVTTPPGRRRRGYAAATIRALLRRLRGTSVKRATALVPEDNVPMQLLLKKLKFTAEPKTITGEHNALGTGGPCYRFTRALARENP